MIALNRRLSRLEDHRLRRLEDERLQHPGAYIPKLYPPSIYEKGAANGLSPEQIDELFEKLNLPLPPEASEQERREVGPRVRRAASLGDDALNEFSAWAAAIHERCEAQRQA